MNWAYYLQYHHGLSFYFMSWGTYGIFLALKSSISTSYLRPCKGCYNIQYLERFLEPVSHLCSQSINGRRNLGLKGEFTIASISKKLNIALKGRTHTQEILN